MHLIVTLASQVNRHRGLEPEPNLMPHAAGPSHFFSQPI